MSSEMAWRAASLISAGAAKSGKPWERLTALCFMARRVISRMTDSVNCSAFAESMRRGRAPGGGMGEMLDLGEFIFIWLAFELRSYSRDVSRLQDPLLRK